MAIGATRELFGMISPDKREDQPFAKSAMLDGLRSDNGVSIGNSVAHPILPDTTMNQHLRPPAPPDVQEQYPFALKTPLDRAYLRPLQQPLFDSEYFVPQKGIKDLAFFCNPINKPYGHSDEVKTKHDTNLWQSKLLDYPIEFSILGFNAIIDSKTSQKDRDALLSNGALFEFKFSGNRPYLSVPFDHVCSRRPSGKSFSQIIAEESLKEDAGKEDKEKETQIDQVIKYFDKYRGSDYHKFNLGKSALKIKPGEEFSCSISWKKTPLVSKPVLIIAELIGLRWTPM